MASRKPSFDIKSMLNTASIEQATQTRKKINYRQLEAHVGNHYSLENIEELADAIQDVGLLQEIIVKPSGEGRFTIIVGHRRHMAITKLVEERGLEEHADVPCVVLDASEDELITLLKLHLTNTTAREMTEHDKMVAISELKEIIQAVREKGIPIKGKVREIIADAVNLGPTQVQKYLNINEQASADVRVALARGDITVQEAYDTTRSKKRGIGREDEQGNGDDECSSQKRIFDAVITRFNAFKKASMSIDSPALSELVIKVEKQLETLREEEGK